MYNCSSKEFLYLGKKCPMMKYRNMFPKLSLFSDLASWEMNWQSNVFDAISILKCHVFLFDHLNASQVIVTKGKDDAGDNSISLIACMLLVKAF